MTTGMTFNGVHSSSFGLLCSPRIPLLPAKRSSTISVAGRDGTYDFDQDSHETRKIPVDCLVKGSSRAALRALMDQMGAWLSGSGYLIFDHDTGKRWQAKVYEGIDPARAPIAAQFTVVFEAQPWPEDVNARTGTIGTAQDYGSPRPFAPVITTTITTGATWLQVTHLASGRYVRIEDTLAVGNVIAIDMNTGKVTKNGASIMTKVRIDSLFFTVPPGSQTITLTTDGAATATMSYRRRYLYA